MVLFLWRILAAWVLLPSSLFFGSPGNDLSLHVRSRSKIWWQFCHHGDQSTLPLEIQWTTWVSWPELCPPESSSKLHHLHPWAFVDGQCRVHENMRKCVCIHGSVHENCVYVSVYVCTLCVCLHVREFWGFIVPFCIPPFTHRTNTNRGITAAECPSGSLGVLWPAFIFLCCYWKCSSHLSDTLKTRSFLRRINQWHVTAF